MAFDTPTFDLEVRDLGLDIDSVITNHVILGMLFNLSGFLLLHMYEVMLFFLFIS